MAKGQKMTAGKKAELVLRIMNGGSEEPSAVALEARIPKDDLLKWKEIFVESGTAGLKGSGGGKDSAKLARENSQLRARLGEMLLEKELKGRR